MLFSFAVNAQSGIVAAGKTENNISYTIGETFPIMQQVDMIEKEVSLGVPKYEIETPKPIIKKKPKSFFERIIEFLKSLINKKQ